MSIILCTKNYNFSAKYDRKTSSCRVGKKTGNLKKPMGMGKTGFYREKWEKREKLPFFKIHILKGC
jgi:hypothetical protein